MSKFLHCLICAETENFFCIKKNKTLIKKKNNAIYYVKLI